MFPVVTIRIFAARDGIAPVHNLTRSAIACKAWFTIFRIALQFIVLRCSSSPSHDMSLGIIEFFLYSATRRWSSRRHLTSYRVTSFLTALATRCRIAGNFRWFKFSHKYQISLRMKFRNLNFRNPDLRQVASLVPRRSTRVILNVECKVIWQKVTIHRHLRTFEYLRDFRFVQLLTRAENKIFESSNFHDVARIRIMRNLHLSKISCYEVKCIVAKGENYDYQFLNSRQALTASYNTG